MGPSGSGKSSLIHALAGLIKESNKITVEGKRYINGNILAGDSILPAAFIEQDVNFFPHMTVKETLDFRVELKLGSTLGKSARDDVVASLLDLLGLTQSANTIVGNSKVRGLSGGERKRLSIACEMISSPPIIILDEPTSGLDSYQANQVVKFLRKLADQGKTVIAVIHQPSQSVLSSFDDLLLLSEGKQMYYGELDNAKAFFTRLGYSVPEGVGLSEYFLECVSRTNGGPSEQKISIERINKIAAEARKISQTLELENKNKFVLKDHHRKIKLIQQRSHRPAAGILRQFKLLLGRALSETVRGKAAMIIKVVQQGF
jgi:ABC-type multidrug transport system ATPase subunit